MKKILFTIAIVLTLSFTANAQGRDGFFSNYDNGYGNRATGDALDIQNPQGHGSTENVDTPLGSGLLVLTALGAGYAVYRKKRS
ncbi:MAG: hypothetical protein J6W12_02675 [Bacteroidales bacterium]|nr:hypothetical protein [Bacteroidales bacterium]